MTIYVDYYPGKGWGKWQGGGHLLTSDIEELHTFAKKLGLRHEWFQDKTFPHYDLVASKRRKAIELGAIEIEPGDFPDDLIVKNREGKYEKYSERMKRFQV